MCDFCICRIPLKVLKGQAFTLHKTDVVADILYDHSLSLPSKLENCFCIAKLCLSSSRKSPLQAYGETIQVLWTWLRGDRSNHQEILKGDVDQETDQRSIMIINLSELNLLSVKKDVGVFFVVL